jgi:hypothetical protein
MIIAGCGKPTYVGGTNGGTMPCGPLRSIRGHSPVLLRGLSRQGVPRYHPRFRQRESTTLEGR